jgi:putative membrane protein (TIGR04086 family)
MSAKSSEKTGAHAMLRPVAVSVVIGAMVCAALLALMSLVLSVQSVPQVLLDPMAVFAMSVGAFASGFCCARIVRKNGLMCGLLAGAAFSVVLLVCGFAVPGNSWGLGALLKVAIALFSSMLGGVLGVNTNPGFLKRRK